MENKYTLEEWEELKGPLLKVLPIADNLYFSSKKEITEKYFKRNAIPCFMDFPHEYIRWLIPTLMRSLFCPFNYLATLINVEDVHDIVSWRLKHGK